MRQSDTAQFIEGRQSVMLNKLKLAGLGGVPSAQHARFTKRKSDQQGWTTGVFLKSRANGDRVWLQRIMIDGKRREIELGSFLTLSLAEAREAAQENRKTIAEGGDIFAELRRQHRQDIRDRIRRLSAKLSEPAPSLAPHPVLQTMLPAPLPLDIEQPTAAITQTASEESDVEKVRALGPHIDAALTVILDAVPADIDSGYVSQDMLALSTACGVEMLERACRITLEMGDCTLLSIVAILDQDAATTDEAENENIIAHSNIRGAKHFH